MSLLGDKGWNGEAPVIGADRQGQFESLAAHTHQLSPLTPISEISLSTDVTRTGKAGRAKPARARKDQVRLKCPSTRALGTWRAPIAPPGGDRLNSSTWPASCINLCYLVRYSPYQEITGDPVA